MFETNELEELLNEIGEVNEALFPGHIIIGILVVILTLWCYLRPTTVNIRLMKSFLAIYYGVIVYTCIICALNMQGIFYYLTVIVHMGVCLLFIFSILKDEIIFGLPEQNGIKFLSIIMMTYGIFLYPLVELFMGYTWPRIFVLSFCPMGIFAIGILITAYPRSSDSRTYQALLILLSLGAVVFGTRTVLIGGIFDLSYSISGIIGFLILLRYGMPLQIFQKKPIGYGDTNELWQSD